MRRPFAVLALSLSIVPALAAQDKPSAALQQAITGTWKLDAAHSEPIPDNPMAGARGSSPVQGGNASRARSAGGGGGGGRGSAGGGGGGGGDMGGGGGGGGGGQNANLMLVMAEVNPGAGIVLAANDSVVAIATANMLKANPNAQSNWKTDGKKHQDAQMDGTIIEMESGWKDNVLTIAYGVVGLGSFTREFKLSKDGKSLELKETINVGGRKAEYKLAFNR